MARVVWKFGVHEPQVPCDHKFLHADYIDGRPYVWLEVDPTKGYIENPYLVYPTGHSAIPDHAEHQATMINRDTNTVWHIYKH